MLADEIHDQAGDREPRAMLSANGPWRGGIAATRSLIDEPPGCWTPPPVIRFGRFLLDRARRRLDLGGARVRVGDRALDILIALAARSGEVVSHNDLLDLVWPGMVADGSNLRFHITALRNALGDPALIRNVHGRGYCLAPPAEDASPRAASTPSASVSSGRAGGLAPDLDHMARRAAGEITRLPRWWAPGAPARPRRLSRWRMR